MKSITNILNLLKGIKISNLSTYSYPEHFSGIIKKLIKKNNSVNSYKVTNHKHVKDYDNSINKKIKSIIFDFVLSTLFYKLLNLNNKGTFIELYIKRV